MTETTTTTHMAHMLRLQGQELAADLLDEAAAALRDLTKVVWADARQEKVDAALYRARDVLAKINGETPR